MHSGILRCRMVQNIKHPPSLRGVTGKPHQGGIFAEESWEKDELGESPQTLARPDSERKPRLTPPLGIVGIRLPGTQRSRKGSISLHTPTRRPLVAAAVALFATVALLPATLAAGEETTFTVPAGLIHFSAADLTINADVIHVDGTLRAAPGASITLHATREIVVSGLVESMPLPPAVASFLSIEDGTTTRMGATGSDGASLVLEAPRVVVTASGILQAGRGADGASVTLAPTDASGALILRALGGHGGHGGSVTIRAAEEATLEGHLLSGSGGLGGAAVADGSMIPGLSETYAAGGDGGSAGDRIIIIRDVPLPIDPLPDDPILGGDGGHAISAGSPAEDPTAAATGSCGATGVGGGDMDRNGGDGGTGQNGGSAVSNGDAAGRGADGCFPGGNAGAGGYGGDATARGGKGGDAFCTAGSGGTATSTGGAGGSGGTGGRGQDGTAGRDGTLTSWDGTSGTSGTNGGRGGNGGQAGNASAIGGAGGKSTVCTGGNGGSANAKGANGGNGGFGGAGGNGGRAGCGFIPILSRNGSPGNGGSGGAGGNGGLKSAFAQAIGGPGGEGGLGRGSQGQPSATFGANGNAGSSGTNGARGASCS